MLNMYRMTVTRPQGQTVQTIIAYTLADAKAMADRILLTRSSGVLVTVELA